MCPMQFYLEYALGWRGSSGKKADKGTICHKVLEIAAVAKKAAQDGLPSIEDRDIGEVLTDNYDAEYLEQIIQKVYDFYTSNTTHHKWTAKDLKDCTKWVWKALQINDGMFDPRNRNVVDAEPHFDFEIKEDWAKYDYKLKDGTKLKGNLAMKGTIDLITDVGGGVYEIIDWKTGRRIDWATGKEKTQAALMKDPQLRIYHYAAKQLYPDVESFLVTIYFINDGGPFTVHLQDSDLEKTEEMLRKKFEFIKETKIPSLIRHTDPRQSWKCSKFCHQGKTTFEGTSIKPMTERRPAQITRRGECMTKCEQTKYMTEKYGIDWVTGNLINPEHVIGEYKAPGEIS